MKNMITIDETLARKVLTIVDAGLVAGLGEPEPGKMCVEAAVNFALGAPHGDEPKCVGHAVRSFKVKLNDCEWSSNAARTEGMRKLAIAQLGSDQIDQMAFGKLMYLRGTQKLMPYVLRKVADKVSAEKKAEYLAHAGLCEKVTTFKEAEGACKAAYASASAYASAYASASASASASAYAYAYAYAYASASAYAYAYASAYAYAYAYAYASASASAYAYFGDELLRLTADVGLECLKEMKSPGCEWLWLCEEKLAA